jgi:2,4-dienoyl-CoA reductase-like NADH-dependent reductase (Old Yellow Enzyme family)
MVPRTRNRAINTLPSDFGRSFVANPDFMQRMQKNDPVNEVDYMNLYTGANEVILIILY